MKFAQLALQSKSFLRLLNQSKVPSFTFSPAYYFAKEFFGDVKMAPVDPILGTSQAYKADKSSKKMNLGVGAYRDDNEKPYIFKVVRKVDLEIANDPKLDKEYIPIDGEPNMVALSQKMMFGENSPAIKEKRVISAQAISGTGALRVAFDFLKKCMPSDVYVPKPTWGNHLSIVQASFLNVKELPYYDPKTRGLDFKNYISAIKNLKPGSVVLLHACAHNPTGVDPTFDQWKEIAKVMKEKDIFPVFDSAYQGFATGDLIGDAKPIRYFVEQGFSMIVTQSFAKNMGLYGERAGAIHVVCKNKDIAQRALSQLKIVIRVMYSSPPVHPARLVAKVLGDPNNFKEWEKEVKMVSHRIIKMRDLLKAALIKNKCPGNWDHITKQIGMFSYTGLTPEQCEILINKWHIYLLKNGRISMCGITTKNVDYLADAIKDSILSTQKK